MGAENLSRRDFLKATGFVLGAMVLKPRLHPQIQAGDGKVDVCHVPPGNPANAHVVEVSRNAWENGHTPHNAHNQDFLVDENRPCPPNVATEVPQSTETIRPTDTPYPTDTAVPTDTLQPTDTLIPSLTATNTPPIETPTATFTATPTGTRIATDNPTAIVSPSVTSRGEFFPNTTKIPFGPQGAPSSTPVMETTPFPSSGSTEIGQPFDLRRTLVGAGLGALVGVGIKIIDKRNRVLYGRSIFDVTSKPSSQGETPIKISKSE